MTSDLIRRLEKLEREVRELSARSRGRIVRESSSSMTLPPGGEAGQVLMVLDDFGHLGWDWPRAHAQVPFL